MILAEKGEHEQQKIKLTNSNTGGFGGGHDQLARLECDQLNKERSRRISGGVSNKAQSSRENLEKISGRE